LVPFVTDGGGNYLAVDGSGAVVDWDHETLDPRVVCASLPELLRLTITAIDKKRLFGGPEKRPGKADPKVKRIENLLAEPIKNYGSIIELSYRVAPADRYRIRVALRDAVLADNPDPDRRTDILDQVATAAAEAGQWDDALSSLSEAGKGGKVPGYRWAAIGRIATEAGAFDPAGKAFAKVKGASDEIACEALVGVALAAWKTGSNARSAIAAAEKAVAKALATTEKSIAKELAGKEKKPSNDSLCDLSWFMNLRAALEQVRGKTTAARATLREAKKRCGVYFDVRELPLAAGLKESDAR
jgi:hypothetical protein